MTRRVKNNGARFIYYATYIAFLKTFRDLGGKQTALAFPTTLGVTTIYKYIRVALTLEHLVEAGFDYVGSRGAGRKRYKITDKGVTHIDNVKIKMTDFVR